MDIELLEQALENESKTLGVDLKQLAIKLISEYTKYFTWNKINRMNLNSIDTRKDTRLDLMRNSVLNVAEKKLLDFSDLYQINYNKHTYIIINLKGEVKEIIINNKMKSIIPNLNIYDLVDDLKKDLGLIINIKEYEQLKNELYIKSLIYNYAYNILREKCKTRYDYIAAGMFKNAYFNIISILGDDLSKKMAR